MKHPRCEATETNIRGRQVWYHPTRIFRSCVAYIKLSTVPTCRSPTDSPCPCLRRYIAEWRIPILHASRDWPSVYNGGASAANFSFRAPRHQAPMPSSVLRRRSDVSLTTSMDWAAAGQGIRECKLSGHALQKTLARGICCTAASFDGQNSSVSRLMRCRFVLDATQPPCIRARLCQKT